MNLILRDKTIKTNFCQDCNKYHISTLYLYEIDDKTIYFSSKYDSLSTSIIGESDSITVDICIFNTIVYNEDILFYMILGNKSEIIKSKILKEKFMIDIKYFNTMYEMEVKTFILAYLNSINFNISETKIKDKYIPYELLFSY